MDMQTREERLAAQWIPAAIAGSVLFLATVIIGVIGVITCDRILDGAKLLMEAMGIGTVAVVMACAASGFLIRGFVSRHIGKMFVIGPCAVVIFTSSVVVANVRFAEPAAQITSVPIVNKWSRKAKAGVVEHFVNIDVNHRHESIYVSRNLWLQCKIGDMFSLPLRTGYFGYTVMFD